MIAGCLTPRVVSDSELDVVGKFGRATKLRIFFYRYLHRINEKIYGTTIFGYLIRRVSIYIV